MPPSISNQTRSWKLFSLSKYFSHASTFGCLTNMCYSPVLFSRAAAHDKCTPRLLTLITNDDYKLPVVDTRCQHHSKTPFHKPLLSFWSWNEMLKYPDKVTKTQMVQYQLRHASTQIWNLWVPPSTGTSFTRATSISRWPQFGLQYFPRPPWLAEIWVLRGTNGAESMRPRQQVTSTVLGNLRKKQSTRWNFPAHGIVSQSTLSIYQRSTFSNGRWALHGCLWSQTVLYCHTSTRNIYIYVCMCLPWPLNIDWYIWFCVCHQNLLPSPKSVKHFATLLSPLLLTYISSWLILVTYLLFWKTFNLACRRHWRDRTESAL